MAFGSTGRRARRRSISRVNIRASDAIVEGFDSLLFIDSDMMFDPADAIRLFQSDEPVIAGVYAAKKLGNGRINCHFEEGIDEVRSGRGPTALSDPSRRGRVPPDQGLGPPAYRKTLELPWCNMAERQLTRSSSRWSMSSTASRVTSAKIMPSFDDAARPVSSRKSIRRSGSGTSAITRTGSKRRRASLCRGRATCFTRSTKGRGEGRPGSRSGVTMAKRKQLTRRERWAPYVRQLADALHLRDWRVEVSKNCRAARRDRVVRSGPRPEVCRDPTRGIVS